MKLAFPSTKTAAILDWPKYFITCVSHLPDKEKIRRISISKHIQGPNTPQNISEIHQGGIWAFFGTNLNSQANFTTFGTNNNQKWNTVQHVSGVLQKQHINSETSIHRSCWGSWKNWEIRENDKMRRFANEITLFKDQSNWTMDPGTINRVFSVLSYHHFKSWY